MNAIREELKAKEAIKEAEAKRKGMLCKFQRLYAVKYNSAQRKLKTQKHGPQ
jgi:hypothetical protein